MECAASVCACERACRPSCSPPPSGVFPHANISPKHPLQGTPRRSLYRSVGLAALLLLRMRMPQPQLWLMPSQTNNHTHARARAHKHTQTHTRSRATRARAHAQHARTHTQELSAVDLPVTPQTGEVCLDILKTAWTPAWCAALVSRADENLWEPSGEVPLASGSAFCAFGCVLVGQDAHVGVSCDRGAPLQS